MTGEKMEILIVGAGKMGTGIALAYAQRGLNVGLVDISDEVLKRSLAVIAEELQSASEKEIISCDQIEEVKNRILTTTQLKEICQGKRLKIVIEAVPEDLEVKKQIFRELDNLCPPHIVLASNNSSLDTNILASETKRPDKIVWMHYFFPAHKNSAAEYAGTDGASSESVEVAAKYMKLAGKEAIPILRCRKGGAANVILVSLLLEAARMVDDGLDIPCIEIGAEQTFGISNGFLSLMDDIGISAALSCMYSFFDSSNPDDPFYKIYNNFFTPSESCKKILEKYNQAKDKSSVRWVSEEDLKKQPEDFLLLDTLKNRFLAVVFMTATEVVDSGVIKLEDVDKLCKNAFKWKEGPYSLMNRMGIREVIRIVTEKMELSHRKEINFPISKLLIAQAQKNQPWPL